MSRAKKKLEKEPALCGGQCSWRKVMRGKWEDFPLERLDRLYRASQVRVKTGLLPEMELEKAVISTAAP